MASKSEIIKENVQLKKDIKALRKKGNEWKDMFYLFVQTISDNQKQ